MNKRKGSKLGIVVVICILVYFAFVLIDQQTVLNQYNKDLKNMDRKIAEQEEINSQLKKQKDMLDSDEYVEEIARTKLGMVKQGEKVFVDVNK
ncbi:MAG: FtsB family cell division protein [Acetivibrionales bacterium]|jgi:cell division protein FtsL